MLQGSRCNHTAPSAILSLIAVGRGVSLILVSGQNGTNIGVTNEIGATLTDAEIARREFGSKCLLAGWNFYINAPSPLPTTSVLWSSIYRKYPYYVATKYLALCHLSDECSLAISTDFVIVSIPVPLLWKVKLNIKRKLIIGVLLCSGVFIMIATLLRCVLSLKDISGINTINAAAIKPLFSASRWIGSSKGSSERYKSSGYAANKYGHPLGTIGGSGAGPSANSANRHRKMMTDLGDNSSEEHIVQKPDYGKKPDYSAYQNDIRAESTKSNGSSHQNGIMVTREYEVSPAKSTLDV
ncbi:integral membrane protein PTH11 [Ilyonectria robusta]